MSVADALREWFISLSAADQREALEFLYGNTLVEIPLREGRYCGPAPSLTYIGKGLFTGPAPSFSHALQQRNCPTCGKPY